MPNVFDLSKFDEYREDNRREVKKQMGVCRFPYGTLILLLRIVVVVPFKMVGGERVDDTNGAIKGRRYKKKVDIEK